MQKKFEALSADIPAVADAAADRETFWICDKQVFSDAPAVSRTDTEDASARLERFAPYLALVFPELAASGGIIESELRETPAMAQRLYAHYGVRLQGRLMLKMDSHLPISGSVKARGGIYEVLKHAETLAVEAGLLNTDDSYTVLHSQKLRSFFAQHTIQVGSTGNLGMSIGIMGAALGFRAIVHMSADAKQWKKDLLRSRGVQVIEYDADYCAAVEQGRRNSQSDPMSYFVDDENSSDLFFGYSVAGKRLAAQLAAQHIAVDEHHPLFVYLPCGIGGAPGGVTYGLKQEFGENVHCFFTEPTQACCMLLGMATGLHDKVSVQDFGISGKTAADGLAVGRASAFVGKVVQPLLGGIATIHDDRLYALMNDLFESEQIFIEPSACAAYAALLKPRELNEYIAQNRLENEMTNATHIAWATGGSMVPRSVRQEYLQVSYLRG